MVSLLGTLNIEGLTITAPIMIAATIIAAVIMKAFLCECFFAKVFQLLLKEKRKYWKAADSTQV